VAIVPDGTWLATAGGGTVRTWAADGTPRAVLAGHQGGVNPNFPLLNVASRE
jgi:hypothetical protein